MSNSLWIHAFAQFNLRKNMTAHLGVPVNGSPKPKHHAI